MRYFNKYSNKKCVEECQSNITLSKCGCIQFDLPRNFHPSMLNPMIFQSYFLGDKNTRICGLSDMPCYYDVLLLFQMEGYDVPDVEACDCLPDCNSVEYEIEVVETYLKTEEMWRTINNVSYFVGTNFHSGLSFAFGDSEYQAIKRSANYEFISFISNVGGLLSLFLGVSFMTVIEIFYFFVLRTLVELTRFLKKKPKRVQVGDVDLVMTLKQLDV